MKKVMSPLQNKEDAAHVRVTVDFFSQFISDNSDNFQSGTKEAVFDPINWETEVLWQTLRVLHEEMDRPLEDLMEIVDTLREKLVTETSLADGKE